MKEESWESWGKELNQCSGKGWVILTLRFRVQSPTRSQFYRNFTKISSIPEISVKFLFFQRMPSYFSV